MKSLGFLITLAAVIVAVSAQNQILATAQSNAEALAGAVPKGARVIHVPAGSTIYHKPPQGSRPAQNQPTQAVVTAQATATAQVGTAKHGPAGHPASPAHQGGSHQPKSRHPEHNPKHTSPPQKQSAAPTATAQATAVAKTKRSEDTKPSQRFDQLVDLPDLTKKPDELRNLIETAIMGAPLVKAGADLITGFVKVEKSTVPVVIADINKRIREAADLLSPENVNKAVNTLTAIPKELVKNVVGKLGEVAVSHADKIGDVIKVLTEGGQLAHAAIVGLAVVSTLGLILEKEVLSKIPLDIGKLPLHASPIAQDKLPIPLDKLPVSLDNLPISLDKLPFPLNKLLLPLEQALGKKSIAARSAGSQAVASDGSQAVASAGSKAVATKGGQAAVVTAQAGSAAQAAVGGAERAVVQAGAAAVGHAEEDIPEDLDGEYDEYEEASAEAVAIAQAG